MCVVFIQRVYIIFNSQAMCYIYFRFSVGPSLAASKPSQSLSDLTDTYTNQNQYFDSTNMAYVLELSNHKNSHNNNNGDDDEINSNNNKNLKNQIINNRNSNENYSGRNYNSFNDSDHIGVNNNNENHNSNNKNYFNQYQLNNNGDDLERVNNPLNRGPFFDVSASKNVTALVGKTANLNCRIKNLGNKTVSVRFIT